MTTPTRFTLDLEFAQSLSNPYYLHHLAAQKYFSDPAFLNYLQYLQYWARPEYAKFLTYPAATLRVLELLQQEGFREQVGRWEVVARLAEGWVGAASGAAVNGERAAGS